MPTMSLDQIRESVQRKYEPLVIPFPERVLDDAQEDGGEPSYVVRERVCKLVQVMRLDKDKRAELMNAQKAAGKDDDAQYDENRTLETLRKIVRIVAENKADVEALLAVVGDDLAVLSEIVTTYTEATSAGEA